ncbi:MAG: hypothetical protein EBT82_02370 [Micrococcales bacterium]|nr:hypothetical protein [Micrococcales bacterium]NBR54811.1 hypothetical protein [Micrococcales bacterium]
MPKKNKAVSLGASCYPVRMMGELFDSERCLFDFGRCSHKNLLFLLKTEFKKILCPENNRDEEDTFRVGFYGQLLEFWIGHQKRADIENAHREMTDRCKRFICLRDFGGHILFVRLRDFNPEPARFLEGVGMDGVFDMFHKEQDEIKESLKVFGFGNFSLLYIVGSRILTLDGLAVIPEGKISDDIYCIESPESPFSKWDGCKKLIQERLYKND